MPLRARRILVAEDETALLDFVSRNLQARGFEVLEATNGLEALALWERESPDLLILDIMMPRLDGLEVCRRVREQSIVPIIVLTARELTAADLARLKGYVTVTLSKSGLARDQLMRELERAIHGKRIGTQGELSRVG